MKLNSATKIVTFVGWLEDCFVLKYTFAATAVNLAEKEGVDWGIFRNEQKY